MSTITCTNCSAENNSTQKYCNRCGFALPAPKAEAPALAPVAQKKKNDSGIAKYIGIAFGILLVYGIKYFLIDRSAFDKALMQAASEINKSCPIMLDSETRLDNAIALPGNVFQYNYTLVNMQKSAIDTPALKNILTPQMQNFVRTNPEMAFARDRHVTLNYYYKDKDAQYAFTVTITPEDYK